MNIPSDCRLGMTRFIYDYKDIKSAQFHKMYVFESGWLALPIKRKHWVAIRNLPSATEREDGKSNYYNLDSKFDSPETIGSVQRLIEYLREVS